MLEIMPDTRMWQQLLVLKLGHQKMLPEKDGFSKVSKLSHAYLSLQKVQMCFLDCSILICLKIYWVNLVHLLFSCSVLYHQTDYFG